MGVHIGVDVGGTNTDAVLLNNLQIVAAVKRPTTDDISSGVSAAIEQVIADANAEPAAIAAVMIGTTHFTNALVERNGLDRVGIIRLASPSGEALPPMTGWPDDLVHQLGRDIHLLPGGYEVDGREMAAFDEAAVRKAARSCRAAGIDALAVSSAFAPINGEMEKRAAEAIRQEHPQASISLSHTIGRLGLVERENSTILNAGLSTMAGHVIASFKRALQTLGITAPLYISQNDGTLISAEQAALYPVLTIGSGPTNSMRGAAFLTGMKDAIVLDVGGTTCDIGALAKGFPRESAIAANIGGVRTNFRMPDIMAIGLGGGTRIHLDPEYYQADEIPEGDLAIGPDSVGFRIAQDSHLFGGSTLTASDIAVAAGKAEFGDPALLPPLSDTTIQTIWSRMQELLAEGIDRMKTAPGDIPIVAVGGGHILIDEGLKGVSRIVRPAHADVANAVGAAIAQIGAQIEHVVDYDRQPREQAMKTMRREVAASVVAAGGVRDTIEIVDFEETFLSYLPGRSAQVRMKAVGDLDLPGSIASSFRVLETRDAH